MTLSDNPHKHSSRLAVAKPSSAAQPDPTIENLRPDPGLAILFLILPTVLAFILSTHFDLLEKLVMLSREHEHLELDEFIIAALTLGFALMIVIIRQTSRYKRAYGHLAETYHRYHRSQLEIQRLKGILPICSSCKKISNDTGAWEQLEVYISEHSEADFSHGMCPDCAKRHYPEYYEED